ncbi:fumarate/nitrate reduction transcriptional regulator Fnr [Sphaerotilaceae bacterium SBD11-9]
MTATPASKLQINCSNCSLRDLCLPEGFDSDDLALLDDLVGSRRLVARGEALFHNGDPFDSIFAVRTGFFKTRVLAESGREQITGFQMAGELLGLNGISAGQHACDAIALEDSQVCAIGFSELEALSRQFPALQRQFHRIMSREIVNDHSVMMLLGNTRSNERVAAFLLNLTQRLQARGFSSSSLVLRMTREEIGTYLGLRLETVSRSLSRLQGQGILSVKDRQICVLDSAALQRVADGSVETAA